MKKNSIINLAMGALWFSLACCSPESVTWQNELKKEIPLLGHRNWIVITDMAYPLQTQPGIKTIYADAEYKDILSFVYQEIEKAPHIKPVIYQDKELHYLTEKEVEGINELRNEMSQLLGDNTVSLPHENLIAHLDSVARLFNVIILKSNLTIPYSSTFFELDCNYWTNDKQKTLQERMANTQKDEQ